MKNVTLYILENHIFNHTFYVSIVLGIEFASNEKTFI